MSGHGAEQPLGASANRTPSGVKQAPLWQPPETAFNPLQMCTVVARDAPTSDPNSVLVGRRQTGEMKLAAPIPHQLHRHPNHMLSCVGQIGWRQGVPGAPDHNYVWHHAAKDQLLTSIACTLSLRQDVPRRNNDASRNSSRLRRNDYQRPCPAAEEQTHSNTSGPADMKSPVGEWLVNDQTARIRIENCGGEMWGAVSWEKSPGGQDTQNPDPAKRTRATLGLSVILNMQRSQDGRWDGEVYDAKTAKPIPPI
jgi:uncharacterized protein (DUF2147 family)